MRIGAVTYLNSKPLVEDLDDLLQPDELVLDYPSCLADGLQAGELAAALVPSVACLRHPDYRVLSDACVASCGAVFSVKLFCRTAPERIRTLALDVGSRTSALLVQILLAQRFGVRPRLLPLPLEAPPLTVDSDAVLLIGDRAMQTPAETFHTVWDLGTEWTETTHLPFVFAVWAARPELSDADAERLAAAFGEARDRGVQRIPQIARREAAELGISVDTAERYLAENLHFVLGSREREGLELFFTLAQELVPDAVTGAAYCS